MPDIKVRVYTQGGEPIDIETPADMHTEEFVNELAAALDLPARDAEGHPVSWRLDNKDTGRTLDPTRSLDSNGVREGHRLSLIREVTAGASAAAEVVDDGCVLVIAPDGTRRSFVYDSLSGMSGPAQALETFGLDPGDHAWMLLPSGPGRCALARTTVAGAGARDPRQTRLGAEYSELITLNSESDYVQVQPKLRAGTAPENYKVIFKCRGIAGIDSQQNPLFSDHHVVSIDCDEDFPSHPPRLHWDTAIWHPNIHHESKAVCINADEWLGAMGVYDLCRQLFEMVQYKNYHAESVPPYPLDQEVARWVREYGEPRGIVNKRQGVYVDDKPFVRPMAVVPNSGLRLRIRPVRTSQGIRIVGRT